MSEKPYFLDILAPYGVATLVYVADFTSVYVRDMPGLMYGTYIGYLGDPTWFCGENLLKTRVSGTLWATASPYAVATPLYGCQMEATSVYLPWPVIFWGYDNISGRNWLPGWRNLGF